MTLKSTTHQLEKLIFLAVKLMSVHYPFPLCDLTLRMLFHPWRFTVQISSFFESFSLGDSDLAQEHYPSASLEGIESADL